MTHPALAGLARISLGSAVACGLTFGSLVLVAWMNEDASPHLHESEPTLPHTVPLMPPPPEPETSQTPAPSSSSPTAPTTAPRPRIAPPAPAPPQVAGLAPAKGPGTLRIGASGSLPSMGNLPGADIGDATTSDAQTPARARSRPAPRYPAVAQRRGIEGYVTVRLRISATGRVEDAVVVEAEPPDVFDEAALGVARRYRFDPARRGSTAVSTTLQQTIRFELQR